MHFNFHLSGDESPEQSRRIANAVLALGGAPWSVEEIDGLYELRGHTRPTSFGVQPDGIVTEKGKDPRPATMDEMLAAGHHVTQGSGRYAEPQLTEDDLSLEPPSPMAAMADALRGKGEAEQFAGALTGDEIRAVESLPPAPPVPTTSTVAPSGLDAKGVPWDERIHSSSRAINADGTWRYRKSVPDETKRDVEDELRGLVQTTPVAPPVPIILPPGSVTDVTPPSTGPMVPGLVPPAPPVPTGALQRTYSDVVNLIMARKVQPDTYVAILGMSLPEFAKHVISAPNDATLMFDALDQASRP